MKTLKKFGLLASVIALTAIAPFLFTGCKTTTSSTPVITIASDGTLITNFVSATNTTLLGVTITPTSVYNTLRGGSAEGARIALKADTNALAYLQAVRQILGNAISTTNFDPAAVTAAINALPISGIHNPTAIEAINGGFEAFEMLQPILQAQINSNTRFVIPALQGIYDGIGDALGIVAPHVTFALDNGYEPRVIVPASLSKNYTRWQIQYDSDFEKESYWIYVSGKPTLFSPAVKSVVSR